MVQNLECRHGQGRPAMTTFGVFVLGLLIGGAVVFFLESLEKRP